MRCQGVHQCVSTRISGVFVGRLRSVLAPEEWDWVRVPRAVVSTVPLWCRVLQDQAHAFGRGQQLSSLLSQNRVP